MGSKNEACSCDTFPAPFFPADSVFYKEENQLGLWYFSLIDVKEGHGKEGREQGNEAEKHMGKRGLS